MIPPTQRQAADAKRVLRVPGFWFVKLGHAVSSVGCRFNGHIPMEGRYARYCMLCGRVA